jgi:hypothetical protein
MNRFWVSLGLCFTNNSTNLAKQQYTKSLQLEVNDSSKLVEVTITLENGTIIHKKICR